jgi:hypothetical protein
VSGEIPEALYGLDLLVAASGLKLWFFPFSILLWLPSSLVTAKETRVFTCLQQRFQWALAGAAPPN